MLKPHFFKAYCKLGIHNLPYGQKKPANGVELAPDFVLSEEFVKKFPGSKLGAFNFSKPEDVDPANYFEAAIKDYVDFRDKLIDSVNKDETLIVAGGDHSITFASILYDLKTFGNNIGIIHFDSHGDICLYRESPSKNFHGMYLRVLFDTFDLIQFDDLVPNKIPTENLLFVGDLELDPGEVSYFKKNNLANINHRDIQMQRKESLKKVEDFVRKFPHIHISFDVDVFEEKIVSATGTPSQNGFKKQPIFEILNILKQAKSLTLDVCEVNPKKEGAEETIKLAQQVMLRCLKNPLNTYA